MVFHSNHRQNLSRSYRITVEGMINTSWSDYLGGVQLVSSMTTDGMQITTLSGTLSDQAALRGLLNRLWDLNLSLRSVQQIDPNTISEME